MVEVVWRNRSTLPQPSLISLTPYYLIHHSHCLDHHDLHTSSTITHSTSTIHSQARLHTTSTITHAASAITHSLNTTSTITHTQLSTLRQSTLTIPQPSLDTSSTITHRATSILPQPLLISTLPRHHSQSSLHTTSTITHRASPRRSDCWGWCESVAAGPGRIRREALPPD